jgi:hypothetical protein
VRKKIVGITIQQIFQMHLDQALRSIPMSGDMRRAAYCIRNCKTIEMGTHVRRCPQGHVSYIENNACKHRFCQQCNALERERWLQRWKQRLLPCPHHHVVFTVPHDLLDLWRYNKRRFGDLLFAAASRTLRELLADPKYCGGRVGLLAALHTWSQTLAAHVHLHVLVTAGGLDEQTGGWKPTTRECLLPRKVLMIVFRGKFRALVREALDKGELKLPPDTRPNHWTNEINRLGRTTWNVKVFGRYQHGQAVAQYLAKYLRGGPIGNSRIISCDEHGVQFHSRVPCHEAEDRSRQAVTKLTACEFIRRLLEHVPERGAQTARGYGLYSGNQHSRLAAAFAALGHTPPEAEQDTVDIEQWLLKLGRDTSCLNCPVCGMKLEIIRNPTKRPKQPARSPPTATTSRPSELSVSA